jgi:hypothetical protein
MNAVDHKPEMPGWLAALGTSTPGPVIAYVITHGGAFTCFFEEADS